MSDCVVRSACIGHCTRFISIPLFRPIPSATDSIIAERFCNATYLQFLLAWRWLGRDVECSIRSCMQLQISLFSILYYSSGLVSVCSCGCGCKCCIRCNREYPQMCSTRAREVSVGCLPRVSRVGPQHFVHKNALLRLQSMGTRFLSLFTTSHCDYDLPVLTPSDP